MRMRAQRNRHTRISNILSRESNKVFITDVDQRQKKGVRAKISGAICDLYATIFNPMIAQNCRMSHDSYVGLLLLFALC